MLWQSMLLLPVLTVFPDGIFLRESGYVPAGFTISLSGIRRHCPGLSIDTPQLCPNTGHKYLHTERLGDIVIGTEIQSVTQRLFFTSCR